MSRPNTNTVREPIAIIGLGGCLPGASNIETYWKNICEGQSAIREVPAQRWNPDDYYSEIKTEPDKTYSKIGGFLDEVPFESKRFRIPPKTADFVDNVQKLALTAVADALEDADLQLRQDAKIGRSFDRERTAVILGNSMGGEFEDKTNLRVWFPEMRNLISNSLEKKNLSDSEVKSIVEEIESTYKQRLPPITEDSMPGELSNCIAGRVANAFDLCGPNFTTDAACAASMAAVKTAFDGLQLEEFDMAVVGGVDQQMDPPTFVKFSKIGALSAEISAPFDARASGFVMGEGVGILVLKRVSDALADGDKIYATIRGIGSASDGKGKGLTAPNPRGQKLAVARAYEKINFDIDSVGLFEAHGTATPVGDRVELSVLTDLLRESGMSPKEIPIGSVKSMIGHLKGAAGAAALIKTSLALHHKVLPPSTNFQRPTSGSPLHEKYLSVNTKTQVWNDSECPRRAGVSAFGFGGTNFHVVLEEHSEKSQELNTKISQEKDEKTMVTPRKSAQPTSDLKGLIVSVQEIFAQATGYEANELEPDYLLEADLGIDTVKQAEIMAQIRETYSLPKEESFNLSEIQTISAVAQYVQSRVSVAWGQGIGNAPVKATTAVDATLPAKMFPYLAVEGVDKTALLNKLTEIEYADASAEAKISLTGQVRLVAAAPTKESLDKKLEGIEKGSPRILRNKGVYFSAADSDLDNGKIAFLFPGQGSQYLNMCKDLAEDYPVVMDTFLEADGILEPMIGRKLTELCWPADMSDPVQRDLDLRQTEICQPAMLAADIALMRLLLAHGIRPDYVVGHSLGEYAACVAAGVLSFADAIYAVSARGREMASVKVDDCGLMAVVLGGVEEVEPIISSVEGYVVSANKNCFKQTVIAGETKAVKQAIEKCVAAGFNSRTIPVSHAFHTEIVAPATMPMRKVLDNLDIRCAGIPILSNVTGEEYPESPEEIRALLTKQLASPVEFIKQVDSLYTRGVRTFIEVGPKKAITGFVTNILENRKHVALFTNYHKLGGQECFLNSLAYLSSRGMTIDFAGTQPSEVQRRPEVAPSVNSQPLNLATGSSQTKTVVSGLGVALPREDACGGVDEDLFDEILRGKNFIRHLTHKTRTEMASLNITRVDKANGTFETMTSSDEVIQLCGQLNLPDLVEDYGVDAALTSAIDATTKLAIATGIEALRDAGLPLVPRYRTTSTGKKLFVGYRLPEKVGKRTGVIFASAFPGLDELIAEVTKFNKQAAKNESSGESVAYQFDRKFLFRILSLGHAQFAQVVGAMGPNTQINAACAAGAQAIGIASDWITLGRCDRVVVLSADDATNESSFAWLGAGFLATGAASVATDATKAAVPFGKNRNGMIMGCGAAAFVVEKDAECRARGILPLVEILASRFANSAFHATRLEFGSIRENFNEFIDTLCSKVGISRAELARRCFFMSHETYTPARGGSSAAEMDALRDVFGDEVGKVLISNTKGFTGHPMGASLEDAVAVKGLQRGLVPPIANFTEVDPDFSDLHFARGQEDQKRDIGIRFAAGFGSQLALNGYRRIATSENRWLDKVRFMEWSKEMSGLEEPAFLIEHRQFRIVEKAGKPLDEMKLWRGFDPGAEAVTEDNAGFVVRGDQKPSRQRSELLTEIVSLFVTETGYEESELGPGFDLESDLGIDTVKQAEILAMVRDRYPLVDGELKPLSELNTIDRLVDFIFSKLSDTAHEYGSAAPIDSQAPLSRSHIASFQYSEDAIRARVLTIFCEQTGYTPSDFEDDHLLEEDLGIDTVKQAEVFSLLTEEFGLERDENFILADLNTVGRIVQFVQTFESIEKSDDLVYSSAQSVSMKIDSTDYMTNIKMIFAAETGYEPEELEDDLLLEADLGIDTVKQAEVMARVREAYGLAQSESFNLSDYQTLEQITQYVAAKVDLSTQADSLETVAKIPTPIEDEALTETVNNVKAPKLDLGSFSVRPVAFGWTENLTDITSIWKGKKVWLLGGDSRIQQELRKEFELSGAQVNNADGNALVTDDTGMEGAGLSPVHGIFLLDSPTWHCDSYQSRRNQAQRFIAMIREILKSQAWTNKLEAVGVLSLGNGDRGFGYTPSIPVDIGGLFSGWLKSLNRELAAVRCVHIQTESSFLATHEGRRALLSEMALGDSAEVSYFLGRRCVSYLEDSKELSNLEVVIPEGLTVVTGGARGVTYEIAKRLVEKGIRRLVLVGRTSLPSPETVEFMALSEAEKKRQAKTSLSEACGKVTPLMVKDWIAAKAKQVEIAENVLCLNEMGADTNYVSCDLGNEQSIEGLVRNIRTKYGEVGLLIHGAGIEESKLFVDKDDDSLMRSFAPKAEAFRILVDELQPSRTLTMGSVAGRFGNASQTDYAAANDALAPWSRNSHNNAVHVDWTAWGDVGMAMKSGVKASLESTGVEFLPAILGAEIGARLALSSVGGEFVVAGELGGFTPAPSSYRPMGHLDLEEIVERSPFDSAVIDGQRCVFRKVFHPEEDLGLAHHKIDGVAVFPGVLGVEFGVQAAEHFIGKPMVEITEVEFKAPIKFHHGKELTVEFSVEKISETQFDIQVLSVFKTPKGLERTKSHFEMKSSISCLSPSELVRYPVAEFCTPTRKSIYDLYFHGESFQVIDWVESLAANGAVAHSFDFKSGWVRNFPAESMTTSPAARELGFQTAGVWEMNTTGKMNLPARIAKVQRRSAVVGEYAVRAIVSQSLEGSGAIDVWVYDTSGNLCDTMIGYETVELRELSKDESANFTPWDLGGDATLIHIQEIKRSITLDGGRALLGYLSDKEMATYSEKKSEKRRLDWSAGRIASKVSLQRRLFQEENIWVPAHHISVEPNALGEPQVLIGGELNRAWSISITHSAGWALAQVGECSKERLGLDVESVESRHPSWGKTYFSENEQKVAWESGGTWLLTACWAVKEALMKALGIGARVDFREIEVQKHEGIWSVTLADSLKMRLLELGAGVSEVTVHLFGDRVLARVKLSMIESTGTVRPKTTEEMPVGHFTSIVAGTRYEIGE